MSWSDRRLRGWRLRRLAASPSGASVPRRCYVVGIFPDDQSIIRFDGSVLAEQRDDWQVSDRRYLSQESVALIADINQHAIGTEVDQHQLPATGQPTSQGDTLREALAYCGQRNAIAAIRSLQRAASMS